MRRVGFLVPLLVFCLTGHALAWFSFTFDEPINKLVDNSAIDIVYDGTYIWLATGNGVSGTNNGGVTWRTYNDATGFTQSSISALATDGSRLWVATSYEIGGGGQLVPAGGGLQITESFGDDWQLVEAEQLSNAGMLAYDLAVLDSSVWAACYYGGLARSLDFGQSWDNIFIDYEVRQDYENEEFKLLRGRYFSIVIDPYYDDSVVVWAGSAEGVQRVYYIGKSKKLAGNRINDIAFDGTFWWYATDRGLSRLDDTLFSLYTDTVNVTYTFLTYDSSNGFQGNFISAVGAEGNLICAGIYDTLAEQSFGFVVSTDGGVSWVTSGPVQAVGAGKLIEEIEIHGGDNLGGVQLRWVCSVYR